MLSLRVLLPLAVFLIALVWMSRPGTAEADEAATARARKVVDAYTAKIRPLEIAVNRAWWDANITGKDEDFARKEQAQNTLDAALADKEAFKEVKAVKDGGGIDDPVLKRAVDIIYLIRLEKQLDADLLKKMTALG